MQEKNKIEMIHHLPRVRWACRRGMLELDLILMRFVDTGYESLSDENKTLFIKLLGCSDPELQQWLMGQVTPSDPEIAQIINIMQNHAKSRI